MIEPCVALICRFKTLRMSHRRLIDYAVTTLRGGKMVLRQEGDGHPSPQGKSIGGYFLWTAGQLREKAGPWPDHIFLILRIRRLSRLYVPRKAPWKSKEREAKGCSAHRPLQ